MTLDELKEDIRRLENAVNRKQKDAWDKWQVFGTLLGSVLVPVALAVVGFQFSRVLTDQQNQANSALAQQQIRSNEEMATNSIRLGQYQIIAGLMKSLLSADATERKQAISFVFIVLRDREDEARQLVYRLSEYDSDQSVRTYAADALNARADELATDALSPDQQLSRAAYGHLTNAWRNDARVTKSVIAAAERGGTNSASWANGVEVLASLDSSQLQPHSNAVASFIHRVPTNTARLQRSVGQLRIKLQGRD